VLLLLLLLACKGLEEAEGLNGLQLSTFHEYKRNTVVA